MSEPINCESGWAALCSYTFYPGHVFRHLHCFGSRKEDVWDRLLDLHNRVAALEGKPPFTRRQLQAKLGRHVKLVRAEVRMRDLAQ